MVPMMSRRFVPISALLAAGCAASQPWNAAPRPLAGPPAQLVVDTSFVRGPVAGCAGRLLDPRDGTRLRLRSSAQRGDGAFVGDYDVEPAGRYGLGANEWLRVDCGAGRVLGAVARHD